MVMNAMRKGAAAGVFKFVIFGFLMMAVGGMVFMDIGGFFRSGGVGATDVARVGGEKVSLQSFDRTVRRSLQQLGIQPYDAYKAGYIDQFLNGDVSNRLMNKSAHDLGVLVDKKRVAVQLREMIAPMVKPGDDAKQVLQQILMNQGLSEGEISRSIGQEITVGLLNKTIEGGFVETSGAVAADLYAFEDEKRDIVFVAFPESETKSIVPPSDEQLNKMYETVKEMYATQETRELELVKITPAAVKGSIEIDEAEVRDAYDGNIDLYTEKEIRTLEQALFDKQEDAQAVADKAKAGSSLKQAVTDVTKRDSNYIGQKDFETDSIPAAIKTDAAAAKAGDTVGPIKTDIGWQVAVVKKIVPSKTKSYDSVKGEIREELLSNKTIDQQYALAGDVEDMLAGGASLEDVKKDIDIQISPVPTVNAYGFNKDNKDALGDFPQRDLILDEGFNLGEGEISPMSETQDGSFVAVHVKKVNEKTYKPFEDVKDEISKRWIEDQRKIENMLEAKEALEAINEAKQSPEDFAKARNKPLQARDNLSRKTAPPKPFTPQSWGNLFEVAINEPAIVDVDSGKAIVWVTRAELPTKVAIDSEQFKEFSKSLTQATQKEAHVLYGNAKADKYGARINKKLLDQAYGQKANEQQ